MKRPRVTPIELSEEQERFFIDTWENNPSLSAIIILQERFGFGQDTIYSVAKRLREKGKLRDKKRIRYSERDVLVFKSEYENGRSLKEIAEVHGVDIKGVRKYLKEFYGGKIPKIKASLEGEIWKDVEGCSNHQVSNMGRIFVKSINLIIYGHIAHGYRHVSIQDDAGNKHKYAVHRLVAQAFVPNPDKKPQVDHIDSDPLNNKASNLRWVTQEEQFSNEESIRKKQLGVEQRQKHLKLKPLIKKMLEIEPDKLELVKMIINYES
jgi:transposase